MGHKGGVVDGLMMAGRCNSGDFIAHSSYRVTANAVNICWKKIGRIKAHHAMQIRSSNWFVGTESMDRYYTIYKNRMDYLGPLGRANY
jgi:hypothetical protein